MILKIDIKEKISTIYSSELSINLVNKNVSYMKGDTLLKNTEYEVSEKEIEEFITNYTTYWKEEEIVEREDEGRTVDISIYTDKEVTTYHFENSFPNDLEEFIKILKNKVGITE